MSRRCWLASKVASISDTSAMLAGTGDSSMRAWASRPAAEGVRRRSRHRAGRSMKKASGSPTPSHCLAAHSALSWCKPWSPWFVLWWRPQGTSCVCLLSPSLLRGSHLGDCLLRVAAL
jgi:hypothetical protein